MKRWLLASMLLLGSTHAHAAIHTEAVAYHDGKTVLEGYVAYDEVIQGHDLGFSSSTNGLGWVPTSNSALNRSRSWATTVQL